MSAVPIAIRKAGLVTSVGLTAPQSCAAFRAKITSPTETRFIGSGGQWIMAHQVKLERPWRGLTKLAKMAAMAIDEALQGMPDAERARLPLLLCVAEPDRPGRMAGLDDELFRQLQAELGIEFAPTSAVVANGRVAVAVALLQARTLIAQGHAPGVLIAATDSLLGWPTLSHYEREGRLLTNRNSNGFMPGEGAGALLVGAASGAAGELACTGIGFGIEHAPIDSGEPLRADGLTRAIKDRLDDAGCAMHDMDFRITDVAGEQYYFKEASLALSPSRPLAHAAQAEGRIRHLAPRRVHRRSRRRGRRLGNCERDGCQRQGLHQRSARARSLVLGFRPARRRGLAKRGGGVSNQVYANNMEVSCKQAAGKSICGFPDVCMTPPQTPATPPGVPVPYPNTGMASDTSDGSTSVKISGQKVMLKNKSYFKKSVGDEAGAAPMKGVVTHTNTGKVYFIAWSADVKVESENVVRNLDMTTHNHNPPPGQTPPMVYQDMIAFGDPVACMGDSDRATKACSGCTPDTCTHDCKAAQACILVAKKHAKERCLNRPDFSGGSLV